MSEERYSARDVAFHVARVARWLRTDHGYTKRMAADELAHIAREVHGAVAERALGAYTDGEEEWDVENGGVRE